MKKIIQPTRKVYGATQQQQQQQNTMQINAVRKINSLLQSGAVSVTGLSAQPRIIQKKPMQANAPLASSVSITTANSNSFNQRQQKCYVCGESAGLNATLLTEASTTTSQTDFTSKIAKIVGEGFMVIVGTDDVVCRRCIALFNQLDKLEVDLENVRTTLTNYIHKKYNILDDDVNLSPPPIKMQKMTSREIGGGTTSTTYSIKAITNQNDSDSGDTNITNLPRKLSNASNISITNNNNNVKDIENQLSNMFDTPAAVATNNGANVVTTASTTIRRNPIKMYKCMSCDFKTQDLTQFQPHYEQCKQNVQAASTTPAATPAPNTTASAYRCKLCKKICASLALLKQHTAQEHHPQNQTAEVKILDAGQSHGSTAASLYSCNMCMYKTQDKQNYDDHLRKHIKLKPFKCRVCLMRFETREQASIHAKSHQPDYFKCGMCHVTFNKREMLMKHLETHDTNKKPKPAQPEIPASTAAPVSDSSTQKLLQATIDEALRDTIGETIDAKSIQFHSCTICSLTFLNEQLYSQHMKMHKTTDNTTSATTSVSVGGNNLHNKKHMNMNSISASMNSPNNQNDSNLMNQNNKILSTNQLTSLSHNTISDGDLESIFEKIHSDKNDINAGDNLVITSQESTSGNITFNITIPQQQADNDALQQQLGQDQKILTQEELNQQAQAGIGIDMPTLDQSEDQLHQQQLLQQQQDELDANQNKQDQMNMPVSMPSLDDDGESQNSQTSNTEAVPMDLDDLQNAGDGQQIKFILNENGQILQLDNHILTTDADGNQIIVQGTDSEQIQQLLQSVGVVMQGGEGLGEGETLQMISGENNQMILVQGADGQEQLIDASLLNADGNIVIQQSQEGELNAEGTHITTEDGIQIPVSVAFTTSGEMDQEGHLTVSMAGGDGSEGQQIHLQLQQSEHDEQQQMEEDGEEQQQQGMMTEDGHVILQQQHQQQEEEHQKENVEMQEAADTNSQPAESENTTTSGGGGGDGDQVLFNFDELIQPQVVVKQQLN